MSQPAVSVPGSGSNPTAAAAILGSALALVDVITLLVISPIPVILCLAPLLVPGDQIDLGFTVINSRPEAWLAAVPGAILVLLIGSVGTWVARRQCAWVRQQITSPSPVPSPISAAIPQAESDLDQLTEREMQVLELMSRGLTNGAIAQELFISEATVRKHVGRIFAKLHVDGTGNDRRVRSVLAFVHRTGHCR